MLRALGTRERAQRFVALVAAHDGDSTSGIQMQPSSRFMCSSGNLHSLFARGRGSRCAARRDRGSTAPLSGGSAPRIIPSTCFAHNLVTG
jgi:hypothetical protein